MSFIVLYFLRKWDILTIFDDYLKEMSKYTALIQDKRFVSGKEMFRTVRNSDTAASLLYKYKKRNIITHIRKNVYLPTNPIDGFVDENKYEIGCNSVNNAYISYHSAMEFYGLQNQVFNRIYLSAPKRFRSFEFDFVEYMYAPDKFQEGIIRMGSNNYIYITDIERTIVDCIDRLDLAGGIEELIYNIELIDEVDENKILHYLSLHAKLVIYQKTGFILSFFKEQMKLSDDFFDICKTKSCKSVRYLTGKNESKKYIPEWKLYVPQYILSLTK